MLKKIVLGALLTGLVAVLIVGAVNRTNAKGSESSGETGRRGQATELRDGGRRCARQRWPLA